LSAPLAECLALSAPLVEGLASHPLGGGTILVTPSVLGLSCQHPLGGETSLVSPLVSGTILVRILLVERLVLLAPLLVGLALSESSWWRD
jgi:hypothetical protein